MTDVMALLEASTSSVPLMEQISCPEHIVNNFDGVQSIVQHVEYVRCLRLSTGT